LYPHPVPPSKHQASRCPGFREIEKKLDKDKIPGDPGSNQCYSSIVFIKDWGEHLTDEKRDSAPFMDPQQPV